MKRGRDKEIGKTNVSKNHAMGTEEGIISQSQMPKGSAQKTPSPAHRCSQLERRGKRGRRGRTVNGLPT